MSAREAKSRIEDMTGINRSPSQVRTFMKKHGLRYIKMGHIPAKADLEEQRKWATTTLEPAIEEAKRGECQLLFMDAAHFIYSLLFVLFGVFHDYLLRLLRDGTESMF